MQKIADICKDQWPTYGRLPSVAIAQAYVESGLFSGGRNLYGVRGCSGLGVYDATIKYFECLNNQYFRGEGAFSLDPEYQLSVIMKGGRYCAGEHPGGRYYNSCISIINRLNLDRFDAPIRKMVKEETKKRRRKERQQRPFHIIFSDKLCPGTCIVDPTYIKKRSTIVFSGGIVEAVSTKRGLKNTIICGCKRVIFPQAMERPNFFDLSKLKVELSVYEDTKG